MAQSTAKRGRPTKQQTATKKSRDLREARRKQRAGLYSVILFAVGFMLLAITFIEGQNVWNYLHRFLFGLLGVCAYITGPLVLMLAVMCAYQKTVSTAKIIESALFAISFSGALFIFTKQQLMGESFWEKLKNLYFSGISKAGGGLSSAILGAPLRAWFGTPGAEITIALLMFVFIMLFAGRTVADIINGVKRPIDSIKGRLAAEADEEDEESVAKQERNYREVEQQVNENAAKLKARTPVKRSKSAEIDISIDGELSKAKRTDIKIDENNAYNVPLGPTFDPVPRSIELESTGPAAQVVKEIFEKSQREAELEDKLFAKFEKSTQQTSVNEYAKAPGDKLDELVKKASQPIAAQTAKAEPVRRHTEYRFPPIGMLKKAVAKPQSNVTAELRANADKLVSTLESFGVKTKVVDISRGPAVTRYELQPEVGVRLSRIVSLSDDLALNLAAPGVRIEAPIPGKAAVGIEVPNKTVNIVNLREVIESSVFTDAKEPLTFALGKDISGAVQVGDIAKMPHLLIAGSTGMGKSVCINSMLVSMLYKCAPKDLQLVLIDPKMVEFQSYNGIPHLLTPVVTDPRKAAGALGWAVGEMLKRYQLFSESGSRNLEEYNAMVDRDYGDYVYADDDDETPRKLPRIVIVIDELADLMIAAPNEVENSILRLAQMARAAGMHLILATQRPSVDVITGVIKNNIPSRIAFAVSSQVDSRTILDGAGAEKLLGRGDMLYLPVGQPKPMRIQGCYVSQGEVDEIVDFLKQDYIARYNEKVMDEIDRQAVKGKNSGGGFEQEDGDDPLFEQAIEVVVEAGQASTSLLQRRLKLGYARAARIMDDMESMGIIGPSEGSKPRNVLISKQQFLERKLSKKDNTN